MWKVNKSKVDATDRSEYFLHWLHSGYFVYKSPDANVSPIDSYPDMKLKLLSTI